MYILSSANALKLDQPDILLFGKVKRHLHCRRDGKVSVVTMANVIPLIAQIVTDHFINNFFYYILWYCSHVFTLDEKYAIFFHISYFDITYFRAFFTCVAMYGTILHPAISPKIKIWTAAIIINFIVKHHDLRTSQIIVLYENIKNYQNACFPNDSHYKFIKNLSNEYAYRQ